MNKKVSTVLTCGLILGGSLLSSSAFAEKISDLVEATPAATIEANAQYVMVQTIGGTDYVYGFQVKADGKIQQVVQKFSTNIDADDLANYAWEITEKQNEFNTAQYTYSFHNVGANADLRTNKETAAADVEVVIDPSVANTDTYTTFVFPSYARYAGASNANSLAPHAAGISSYNYLQFDDNSTPNNLTDDKLNFNVSGASSVATKFYKIASKVVGDETLNKLYNSKGFSFAIDADGEVVENPFQNLRAINVEKTVNVVEDGKTWGFPEGTYFVTKESYDAMKEDFSNSWTDDKKLEFLRQLTFIAVSSTESVELSGIDRENGQGFEFVQISGDDLYDYIGTDLDKQPQNDQLSVYNACFHVEALSTAGFPYSIKLKEFFYVADADALAEAQGKGEDYEQANAEVNIEVLKHGSPASYYLTTSKTTTDPAKHLFKFDQSNVQSGISFLKTDGPAVYNIRFVSGEDDETERGKYLTVGTTTTSGNFAFVAKGEALTDADALATPVYQFVITSVKDNDVTFTNRETGENFTTQLFLERTENGTPIYSLNPTSASDKTISIVNIKSNSYGTEINNEYNTKLSKVEVELIESTADQYAGYSVIEEEDLKTIKFARDAYSTSNLWYAAVEEDGDMYGVKREAVLSDDLYSAAQWQLIKVDSVDLKRDYAYNNKNVVAIKGYGDILKAYVYALRYVTDGTAQDAYLKVDGTNGGIKLETNVTDVDNADQFIVRENPNGSINLIAYDRTNVPFNDKANALKKDVKGIAHLNYSTSDKIYQYSNDAVYYVVDGDEELLTFLVDESPEISWPAEEGHVTITAEGGDYLTMSDENNDAIIVDEANADGFYLHVTDRNAIVPSFYISKGMGEGSTAESERMFLFNPIDSAQYQVNMDYDPDYQLDVNATKAVFKSGILNETRDTLSLTVKGEVTKKVAMKSNNQQNVWGGLNRFKVQIIETEDGDAYYYIRQPKADKNNSETWYLANINDKAAWVSKDNGMVPPYAFAIEAIEAPTANEGVATSEVKVIAYDGAINIKNAAGKNVVISTILGQIVANEVLTSDNATIAVPAGIAIVSVDGEEAVKVSVK